MKNHLAIFEYMLLYDDLISCSFVEFEHAFE